MIMKESALFRHTMWYFFLLSLAVLTGSCEKVVSVDLHTTGPQIVIEGIVSDQNGPYTVSLSKTGNYFTPSLNFPPVSHAVVVIVDTGGGRDTLNEKAIGMYQSRTIRGVPGITYVLTVVTEGTHYTASSTMPQKVFIDSMYAVSRRPSSPAGAGYDLYLAFKDPPELGNYYRINVHVSDPLIPADSIDGRRYRLYNDKLTNGNEELFRVRIRRSVVPGDTVTVDLLSIDKATYDYYRTLNDILTSDRSPTSLSPANPNTNLSDGSLGYFSAYAIDTKRIVLQ